MCSMQPQRRRLHAILDELEQDVLRRDDVEPLELQRAKERIGRIFDGIQKRCVQGQRASLALPTGPRSAGEARPATASESLPTERHEVENTGPDPVGSDCGVATRLTAGLKKVNWVDATIQSLTEKQHQIEEYARLPLKDQLSFDWDQDDVRVSHCLTGVPKGSDGHLRSLAARSLALQYESWIFTRPISERRGRNAAKNGDIPLFVNTLDLQLEDKKPITAVIGVGRKMLLLENAFGCSAISAVVAFVWRRFKRARSEDITQLGSKLRDCWLSKYAEEHKLRFDEGFSLYEEKRRGRKRRRPSSPQEESTACKRARDCNASRLLEDGTQNTLLPADMQLYPSADYFEHAATGRSSGIGQQACEQAATITVLATDRGTAAEGHIEGNTIPASNPEMQCSAEGWVDAQSGVQWNHLASELAVSTMPAPQWHCSATDDAQWNHLASEMEASTMPAPQWHCSVPAPDDLQCNSLASDMEASTMSAPQWHYSVPAPNGVQWTYLASEMEASMMPAPQGHCSMTGVVPTLNDVQWNRSSWT